MHRIFYTRIRGREIPPEHTKDYSSCCYINSFAKKLSPKPWELKRLFTSPKAILTTRKITFPLINSPFLCSVTYTYLFLAIPSCYENIGAFLLCKRFYFVTVIFFLHILNFLWHLVQMKTLHSLERPLATCRQTSHLQI